MSTTLTQRPGDKIGAENLHRVRQWLADHPGGTQRECAKALKLSSMAVGRHVKTLRSEWRKYQRRRLPAEKI